MKRLLILFTAFQASLSSLLAGPLDLQEAMKRASQFLESRSGSTTGKAVRLVQQQLRRPGTGTAAGPARVAATGTADAAYYVFNVGNDEGFVIVSGDDRTPSILGYADSGAFDIDNIPDNMKAWLDSYEEQIVWLDNDSISCDSIGSNSKSSVRRAPQIRRSIAPLLTTTWDQNNPYNRQVLDTLVYTDKCFTGCVATAMAQLLNYHAKRTGRPAVTTADIPSYTTASVHYEVQGVAAGTPIDWPAMQDSYRTNAYIKTAEQLRQVTAVGQLMHICGASVQMNYGTGRSGANSWIVPATLKRYFGYDQATRMADRYNYTLSEWYDLIYEELVQQRPVYMTGASSGGGHAFIIDGFDGDELFHFNWGWGGHCNGYYLLSLSNPTDKKGIGAGNSDDGYTMRQGAIVGAQPATSASQPTTDPPLTPKNYRLELVDLRYKGDMTAKRKQEVEAVIRNTGDEFYGNIHLLTKRIGIILTDTCSVGVTILKGQTQTVEFSFTPPEAREYIVRLFTEIDSLGDLYTDTVVVAPQEPTSNDVNLLIDMKITNLDSTREFILGNKAHMVTTVRNNTGVDYEGVFVPMLMIQGGGSFSYQVQKLLFEAYTTTVLEDDFDVSQGTLYRPLCITEIPGRTLVYQPEYKFYIASPAVTIYRHDGSRDAYEASEMAVIPPDAVSVDLVGNYVTQYVKPSANVNCVYFLSEDAHKPEGLTDNVVLGTHADRLRISDDGLSFRPMADFTADTVVYTRTFTNGTTAVSTPQGTVLNPSWTTLCLPFTANRCLLADGSEVRWMQWEGDSNYNFWLMEFLGDEQGTLFFAPVKEMRAYTPYLVSVPSAGMPGYRDMTGTPVTFCGHYTTVRATASSVASSNSYRFMGTMGYVNDNSRTYAIDTDGRLCHRTSISTQPFRAYIKANTNTITPDVAPVSIAGFSYTSGDEPRKKADVNGDGTVDVADISTVILVMAGERTDIPTASADVNGDGTVDVADISAIITTMAGN